MMIISRQDKAPAQDSTTRTIFRIKMRLARKTGCHLVALCFMMTLLDRRRLHEVGVTCQGHFEPILHPSYRQPQLSPATRAFQPSQATMQAQQVAFMNAAAAAAAAAAAESRGLHTPLLTGSPLRSQHGLMNSLGSRGQSYLSQMLQNQQRQRQHYESAASFYATAPGPWHSSRVANSDRRASSSTSDAINQLLVPGALDPKQQQQHVTAQGDNRQQQQQQQVPTNVKIQDNNPQQQQQHQDNKNNNGKLLICYYTTKQTAPYWPKDAREFVVPADRLNQVATNFAESSVSPSPAFRFSPQIKQQQQQMQRNNAFSGAHNSGAQEAQAINAAHKSNDQQLNSFAGGRMIVVAPKFVPFNHTTATITNRAQAADQVSIDSGSPPPPPPTSSFEQMFNFMPSSNSNNEQQQHHHQPHNTIASRRDNAASITTTSTTTTNQQAQRQSTTLVPQMAELIVSNNDNLAGGTVFTKINRNKQDLNGGGGVGGGSNNRMRNIEGGLQAQDLAGPANEATSSASSPSSSSYSTNNIPQPMSASAPTPMLFVGGQNNGATRGQPPSILVENVNQRADQQLERSAQVKHQQLMYSPAMSRAFLVGASAGAPPSTVAGSNNNNNNNGDSQDQMLSQIVPLVNVDNNSNDYYYYYNQPSSPSGLAAAAATTSRSKASAGSTAATTISLATTSYRPIQQQHQHELSRAAATNANSNLNGGLQQRGKSLQVAESELSPALPSSSSSLAPITFADSLHNSPPSYTISGGTSGQSQTLDRLIVGNGPSSSAAATMQRNQQQQQRYSSPAMSSSSSLNQASGFTPTSDMFKSTSDDNLISSGTKTTPFASLVSPSSSSSSSSPSSSAAAAQSPSTVASQQLVVSSLPSGLLSYSSPTSIATAQPPNGSSTAAAAAAAAASSTTTTSAQMSDSVGGSSMLSAAAAAVAADAVAADVEPANNNNRHHHQHNNNKQIVGVGGNSLSAALVSSPLSTMFDVFGAASQYLMRFKPSSLISPSSFASLNSIVVGDSSSHHHNTRSNSSLAGSLPFASGILASGLHHKSNVSSSGFLSRLTLQNHQRREDICGRTIQTPERRIIGGEGARYGEFPYQVHIKIAKHQCGGALIDKQSIVTAAHCVYHFITRAPVSKLQIVIGAYDIEDEQYQELPPQYFKVNRVKLHPNFRFSASHPDRYDIAILKLDKPVKYTDNVLPVCLPAKDLKYESMVGTVTGFGKTDPSLSNRYGTRLLQKVDVPIIENGECERWHRTRGIDLKIFPEMMCAGYEDGLKDACVGDSGGPLVVKTPVGSNGSFRWTLAGITSAGFGCAQSRQPGIYHRVSHTVDWILDNLD